MCYIMISKKLNDRPGNEEAAAAIREIAAEQMKRNDDGYFFLDFTQNYFIRTLNTQQTKEAIEKSAFDNIMLHWRMASAGAVNAENVHGWIEGNYQFLHNGHISDYSNPVRGHWDAETKTWTKNEADETTDSYKLFLDILKELEPVGDKPGHKQVARAIREAVNAVNFWGRAILYDRPSDRAFLFGDWHLYLIAESHLVISSADLKIDGTKTKNIHGLPFEYTDNMGIIESEMDGISVIKNFSKPHFQYKYLMELEEPYNAAASTSVKVNTQTTGAQKQIGFSTETEGTKTIAELEAEKEMEPIENACAWNRYGEEGSEDMPPLDYMRNPDGEEVEVYTDETGTHDIYNECCEYGYCGQFTEVPIYRKPQTPEQEAMIENMMAQVGAKDDIAF